MHGPNEQILIAQAKAAFAGFAAAAVQENHLPACILLEKSTVHTAVGKALVAVQLVRGEVGPVENDKS